MDMSVIWIAAIIIFAILELVTYQIVSVWFAIGAVGGLIAYLLGYEFNTQMVVFLVVSIIMLCALRPLSVKHLKPTGLKTNVDNLIGKDILITEKVDNVNGSGKGSVNGMTWTVRSADGSEIEENTKATIEKIEGVKLIVSRKGEEK